MNAWRIVSKPSGALPVSSPSTSSTNVPSSTNNSTSESSAAPIHKSRRHLGVLLTSKGHWWLRTTQMMSHFSIQTNAKSGSKNKAHTIYIYKLRVYLDSWPPHQIILCSLLQLKTEYFYLVSRKEFFYKELPSNCTSEYNYALSSVDTS